MRGFYKLIKKGYEVERIATGFGFTEGPVWNKKNQFLLFSDVTGNIRRKWSQDGSVEEVKNPSNKCNGMTYDSNGNLIVCEHSTSRLIKERPGGSTEIIASHYKGKELNSPNDVIVADDGSIYFTDPTYGRMPEPGIERDRELDFQGVYRIDPGSRKLELIIDDFTQPNGLCLSPDEKTLYVNDSELCHIRAFSIAADDTVSKGSIFYDKLCTSDREQGVPDGMKCDELGNIYVTGPGGIWIFNSQGENIGLIEVPERVGNLNWGGKNWSTLYITASTSVYRVEMKVKGNKLSYMNR
jgi:gluconolactonase